MRLLGQFVEPILIEFARTDRDRLRAAFLDDDVRDQLVALAFLVLLAPRVQVAGVDDRQRHRPAFVLAQAFGEQLVVPQADRFEPLAPGGEHANVAAALDFHQMADADVVESHFRRRQPWRNVRSSPPRLRGVARCRAP